MTGTHARTAGKIMINGSISFAAVLGAFGWAVNHTPDFFVSATAFHEYRAAMQLQHTTDSLVYVKQLDDMRRDIKSLVSACQRHGDCP